MYLGGNRRWVPLIRSCRTREGAWDGRFYNAKFRPLDPRIRTTTRTIVDFLRVLSKSRHPGKLHCTFFHQ